MRIALVLVAGLALAGCAGSPVGDAIAGPEKLAAQDDALCRSYGVEPGSDAYVACRMNTQNQRHAGHQAAYNRAAAGMIAAGEAQSRAQAAAAANRPIMCRNWGNGTVTCQ